MEGWNPSYNWTKDEYKATVRNHLEKMGEDWVCIEVSHSSAKNISDIIKWAKEDGYFATEKCGGEVLKIEKWKGR